MGFCLNYLILISCFGVMFFCILGAMVYLKSEALEVTDDNRTDYMIKLFSTAGVINFNISYIFYFCFSCLLRNGKQLKYLSIFLIINSV